MLFRSLYNAHSEKLKQNIAQLEDSISDVDVSIQNNTQEISNLDKEEDNNNKAIDKLDEEILKNATSQEELTYDISEFKSTNKKTLKEQFIEKYIESNYVKNNLFQFVKNCKNLDSVPEWRALISKLIVSYIISYVADPNDPTKYINVIPS